MNHPTQLAHFDSKQVATTSWIVADKIKSFHAHEWRNLFLDHRNSHPKDPDHKIEQELRKRGHRPNGHLYDSTFNQAIAIHVWAKHTTDATIPLTPDDMFVLNDETMEKEIYGR